MSTAEIRESINRMTADERLFTLAYLKHVARADDPTHKRELGKRMRRMDRGKSIDLEAVKDIHNRLKASGL